MTAFGRHQLTELGLLLRAAARVEIMPRFRKLPPGAIRTKSGPLDLVMGAALRRVGVPFAVVVHDADLHPGDTLRLQAVFQRVLPPKRSQKAVLCLKA